MSGGLVAEKKVVRRLEGVLMGSGLNFDMTAFPRDCVSMRVRGRR